MLVMFFAAVKFFVALIVLVAILFFVILAISFFVVFVRRVVMFEPDVIAKGGDVQRIFMRSVCSSFGDGLRGAYDFLNRGLVIFLFFFVSFFLFG